MQIENHIFKRNIKTPLNMNLNQHMCYHWTSLYVETPENVL